jgi:hypothetical protein
VLSFVPRGFEAYCRIFHPAGEVSWAEIASANGHEPHALMQLPEITNTEGWHVDPHPGVFDELPRAGELPEGLRAPVTDTLRSYTATPESCWFAVWEGYGALRPDVRDAPWFRLPHRKYHLFHGPIEALLMPCEPAWWDQTANIWWPADRTWCVATEVDLMSTYVGGSTDCIAALAAHPALEAYAVDPGDPISLA